MATDTYKLTRDRKALVQILERHAEREEGFLTYRRTIWLLAWYYLNGARRFDLFDPSTGLIRPHHLDKDGNMEFQSQELLSAIDRVAGRLAAMDVRPKVERKGMSLPAIRDRAVGQIILDAMVSEDQIDRVKTQFAHLFTALGSAGVVGHITDHPTIGLTTDFEVIHPKELYPFPSLATDYTKQRGIMREHVVPLDYLKSKYGRRIADNLSALEWWEAEAGDPSVDLEYSDDGLHSGYSYRSGATLPDGPAKTTYGLVNVKELWILGHQNTCTRYIVTSGDYLIDDLDFEDLEVYCPIGFARFIENGSFHGAGLFDLLFSIHREMERLLKSLFNNIRDTDKYGILVMPSGQWNERQMLRDIGRGLRVVPWEPDPMSEAFRPFPVQPVNLGDVPGKTAAFAKDLMASINPWRDIIAEKGRVDSASGLGFLDEQMSRMMSNPTRGMQQAFADCHRSVLNASTRALSEAPRPLPVQNLTLDLAGVVIDREAGTVDFQQNPLPTMSQLSVTIREVSPKSEVARKQEAIQLYGLEGFQDPLAFKLFALKESLDFAMWLDEEKAAYETVIQNCLILYGDGVSTGRIIGTPHTSAPEAQLRVLSGFMTSPTMAVASPEVQDAFKMYRERLIDSMGMTLPSAIPNPDDLAMLMTPPEKLLQMAQSGGQGQQQQSLPFPQQQGVA
jgi:hypothetical protein